MTLVQRNLLHGGALDRGGSAGRPQGRQQQRRLAQVRPAAFVPVWAVRRRGDLGERGDERGRVGRRSRAAWPSPRPPAAAPVRAPRPAAPAGRHAGTTVPRPNPRGTAVARSGTRKTSPWPRTHPRPGWPPPENCSGGAYASVPPAAVRSPALTAIPKSVSLLAPSWSTSTLSGL